MTQWLYVLAAYAVVVVGCGALLIGSWRSMRRAEARAAEVAGR